MYRFVIKKIENLYCREVEASILTLTSYGWELEEVCRNSRAYELGTCECHSHPAYSSEKITRRESLELLRKWSIENEQR